MNRPRKVKYTDNNERLGCIVSGNNTLSLDPRNGYNLSITKTRMNGLSCGEESMTIYSAVLIQCQRVTDGQTDRQTDRRPAYIYYVLQHETIFFS